MNAESRIRELVGAYMADDHKGDLVRFLDGLLALAAEVGEIRCGRVDDMGWRFETSGQTSCVISLSRARTKLRIICARLSVLCNESGDPECSIYGGESFIRGTSSSSPNGEPRRWKVSFMNTPSEHHFTITPVPADVPQPQPQEAAVPSALQ
jgi:hypothetical protein